MRDLSPTEQTIMDVVAAADRAGVEIDADDIAVLVMEQRGKQGRTKGRESWRRRILGLVERLEDEGLIS